ncbi:probable serine/threonine-protein kinase kinX [Nasonia vitripennis]|uniref:Uncharacterized protein n=1 Tax=Nasonia vitripennis TaxID=7425 RepID=A0A7M7QUL9_NASVI|nr:probable serine/threonine-protein kinase kinX [Nasonia vitripennis]XP_032453958.1 probable serine/threonine-protein kinase kinX [Nasonia vitripennis]
MLALLLRGFFLLTVVGWYSTSLWKMIDGYFKGQFQRYLEEEYQRNPKMRQDVRTGFNDAADKSASPVTEELQQVLRSCSTELAAEEVGCTVGEAELAKRSEESGTTPAADAFAAGAAAEIEEEERDEVEMIVPEAEKEVDGLEELAFREKPARERDAEPPDEEAVILQATIENESVDNLMVYIEEIEARQPGLREDRNEQEYQQQQQQQHRKQHQSQRRSQRQKKEQQCPKPGKKRKFSGRPQIGAKSEKATSKKNRHGPLTLTDEDFERVSRKKYRYTDEEGNIVDRDFSEFDDENSWTSDGFDDEDEEDKRKRIPLADLPYKPAVDVYDLDRLSEEEFCPLTLDDDPTCEETRPWP